MHKDLIGGDLVAYSHGRGMGRAFVVTRATVENVFGHHTVACCTTRNRDPVSHESYNKMPIYNNHLYDNYVLVTI